MSDSNYDKVLVLIPCFGPNNGVIFRDVGPLRLPLSIAGDAKTVTTLSKFYGSSGYFDGNGDYLSANDQAFVLSGDYTFEAWIYVTSLAAQVGLIFVGTYGSDSSRTQLALDTNGQLIFYGSSGTTARFDVKSAIGAIATGQWYHVAGSLQGTSARLFINGVLVNSATASGAIGTSSYAAFGYGRLGLGNRFLPGYLQDVRITKGLARYTANFTPPDQLAGRILGTITDESGSPAARTVFAVPRAFPSSKPVTTLSSAVDGSYELWVPNMEEISRVVLADDSLPLKNDIIDRIFPG